MRKLVLAFLLILSISVHAYESDQHTVPNQEVADVGSDISAFIYNQINIAITKINTDIKELPAKIENIEKEMINEGNPKKFQEMKAVLYTHKARLHLIKSKMGITLAVYLEIGGHFSWEDQRDGIFGLPLSLIPYPENLKENKIITYVPSRLKNIYAFAGFHRLISSSYFVFCSSMKMFGIYFGVDKLGHMFNQGYEYFQRYHKKLNQGSNSDLAMKSTIDWGRSTENGMYGVIVDGVYSNGDLAANLAGFYFYENLLHSVKIGDKNYLPILSINENQTVEFNLQNLIDEKELLVPFFSNHLNEALNPSHYEFLQRKVVKKAIVNRCERIKIFYNLSSTEETKSLTDSLFTWHGLDYGHRSDDLLKLDELCF